MGNPNDDLLREFLQAIAKNERNGHSTHALHQKIDRICDKVDRTYDIARELATEQIAQRERQNRHGRRLRTLEQKGGEDQGDITGVNQINDYRLAQAETKLFEEEKRKRDSIMFKRSHKYSLVMGIVAALFVSAVTGCVTYALTHVKVEAHP